MTATIFNWLAVGLDIVGVVFCILTIRHLCKSNPI